MKRVKMFGVGVLVFLMGLGVTLSAAWPGEPYPLSFEEAEKCKGWLDDPAPFYKNIDWYRKVIPPEVYAKITHDVEKMKATWAECVGFKAPDVVGKIAPEIKPGKYTYKDKAKYPFDKLMWKHMYDRFNPPGEGTPNHVGNFTEIEIVPTRQYYYALPVAEATLKNIGKSKQDNQGYLIEASYEAGYPFPRPSGKFKAQQILYNWKKKYYVGEDNYWVEHVLGVNNRWNKDSDAMGIARFMRNKGRVMSEPFGWLDKRAEKQNELRMFTYQCVAPRDAFGNNILGVFYCDPLNPDLSMIYVNVLRRIRRMSSSDMQDPAVGQDMIYDDAEGFGRKLSPKRFPYEYKLIGEQEFLVPMTIDGSPYIDSKDKYSYKKLTFERRPMYVIELKQLDPNYVYGKTVAYFDKETLVAVAFENYDQKGRYYRSYNILYGFIPQMGLFNQFNSLALDHVDTHSTWMYGYCYPALWLDRTQFTAGAIKRAK